MKNRSVRLNRKRNLQTALCGAALMAAFPLTAAAGEVTDDTWAIYWYLCGSDLETNYGAATSDIVEMLEVSLPENVKVVIETGGAGQWQNEMIDSGYLERYVYDNEDLKFLEQLDSASMGETETLADFLSFCRDNYPAEHTAVIFWDHGGGSASGVAFDELYGYDSLILAEIYDAFDQTFSLSEENPPLDLVGFDACLMATVDTANTFSDIASYMVASEEVEPGNGWYYTGWLGALAEDPSMDAGTLGTAVCDSYMEGCEAEGTGAEATLSLVDLGKLPALLAAYENLGRDNDIDADWDNGTFTDNFRGVWGTIDDCLCYMEIIYEGEDYNLYSIPIRLNGEECQLRVVYDYTAEDYEILGARKGLDENGMSDRNLIQLQPGDEITTLHYAMTVSGEDEEFQMVDVDTFTVTEDTSFGETELGDGTFMMYYELVDARNTDLTSQSILFTVADGEITTEVM